MYSKHASFIVVVNIQWVVVAIDTQFWQVVASQSLFPYVGSLCMHSSGADSTVCLRLLAVLIFRITVA